MIVVKHVVVPCSHRRIRLSRLTKSIRNSTHHTYRPRNVLNTKSRVCFPLPNTSVETWTKSLTSLWALRHWWILVEQWDNCISIWQMMARHQQVFLVRWCRTEHRDLSWNPIHLQLEETSRSDRDQRRETLTMKVISHDVDSIQVFRHSFQIHVDDWLSPRTRSNRRELAFEGIRRNAGLTRLLRDTADLCSREVLWRGEVRSSVYLQVVTHCPEVHRRPDIPWSTHKRFFSIMSIFRSRFVGGFVDFSFTSPSVKLKWKEGPSAGTAANDSIERWECSTSSSSSLRWSDLSLLWKSLRMTRPDPADDQQQRQNLHTNFRLDAISFVRRHVDRTLAFDLSERKATEALLWKILDVSTPSENYLLYLDRLVKRSNGKIGDDCKIDWMKIQILMENNQARTTKSNEVLVW